uniref:Uncharacterized protein n=1 Tax=Steinernema glaseri TaxID=37863 RepID=A0A1I7YXS1_9BILA
MFDISHSLPLFILCPLNTFTGYLTQPSRSEPPSLRGVEATKTKKVGSASSSRLSKGEKATPLTVICFGDDDEGARNGGCGFRRRRRTKRDPPMRRGSEINEVLRAQGPAASRGCLDAGGRPEGAQEEDGTRDEEQRDRCCCTKGFLDTDDDETSEGRMLRSFGDMRRFSFDPNGFACVEKEEGTEKKIQIY